MNGADREAYWRRTFADLHAQLHATFYAPARNSRHGAQVSGGGAMPQKGLDADAEKAAVPELRAGGPGRSSGGLHARRS